MLSLIGLILFELIFEARARHLIVYASLYIVLAITSGSYLLRSLFEVRKKLKSIKTDI